MGFQSGLIQASGSVETRMTSINETLRRIMEETHSSPDLPTDLPPDALQPAPPRPPPGRRPRLPPPRRLTHRYNPCPAMYSQTGSGVRYRTDWPSDTRRRI